MNPNFIDPETFYPVNLFVIVLVDDRHNVIGGLIKQDTGGNYNHIGTIHKPMTIDSQDMFFHERPLQDYMTSENMLKFWIIKNLKNYEWAILNNAIEQDLRKPFWQRFYNYLGIVGQALRLPWISFPGTYFCSQRVSKYLRLTPRIASILPENVSPVFDDTFFINHSDLFTCLGYWWSD
jgi:hypothetical protein